MWNLEVIMTKPDLNKEITKQDPEVIFKDFEEALELLALVGPNPLLIKSDDYWDRYYNLTDKYYPQEEEEDE